MSARAAPTATATLRAKTAGRPHTRLLGWVAALALLASIAQGADQAAPGGVDGRVLDSSGGGVEGVSVDVKGPASRSATSDSLGHYRISGLPAGTYSLVAVKKGFAPYSATLIVAAAPQALDITLSLAPVEEKVTVRDEISNVSVTTE